MQDTFRSLAGTTEKHWSHSLRGGTVREDTCLSGHVQFEVLARREVWEVGGSTLVGVRAGMEA